MKTEKIVKCNGVWYDVFETLNAQNRIFVICHEPDENGIEYEYILEDDCEIIKTIKVED